MHSRPTPSRALRVVRAKASHAADGHSDSPHFAERPTQDDAETEAEIRGGLNTIALLATAIVAVAFALAWALQRWDAAEPVGIPCGKTIKLGNGFEAFVMCDDDDAPRSGD